MQRQELEDKCDYDNCRHRQGSAPVSVPAWVAPEADGQKHHREDSASHVYEETHRVDVARVSRSRLFQVRREDRRDHQADTT